jgi:hypothetical protein
MLEQAGGGWGDAPVAGVWDSAPSGQMLPYLIDDLGDTVGLACDVLLTAQIKSLLFTAGL